MKNKLKSFEMKYLSFPKRYLLKTLYTSIFILPAFFIFNDKRIFIFIGLFAIILIYNIFEQKIYLKKLDFYEQGISIEYYIFNVKKNEFINYNSLKIKFGKTFGFAPATHLTIKSNDKIILSQSNNLTWKKEDLENIFKTYSNR